MSHHETKFSQTRRLPGSSPWGRSSLFSFRHPVFPSCIPAFLSVLPFIRLHETSPSSVLHQSLITASQSSSRLYFPHFSNLPQLDVPSRPPSLSPSHTLSLSFALSHTLSLFIYLYHSLSLTHFLTVSLFSLGSKHFGNYRALTTLCCVTLLSPQRNYMKLRKIMLPFLIELSNNVYRFRRTESHLRVVR